VEKTFRITLLNIFFTIFFVLPKNIFAISAPDLLSPADSSTVTSSKLEWQAPSYALFSSSPYRVQVDDNSDFSSIYRDYYTSNTHYTPSLTNSTWYWKVKVKDSAGTWSDWSSIWSFTLSTSNTPSPTTTLPEESYSTPYSTPPSTDNNPTPTSTSSKSSFTISGVPSTIDSDQSFIVSVELNLPNNPSSTFYLKGAFKKTGGSNYFGFTKVGSSWIKNGNSYSSQLPVTTDSSGNWSGTIDVKSDGSDSGFTGTGDYIFKIGRYSSSGSGPIWSNEETLNITGVTSSKETSDTNQGLETFSIPQGAVAKAPSTKNSIISTKSKTAVAGVSLESTPSSSSPTPQDQLSKVDSEKKFNLNYIPVIGGTVLILSGFGSLIYIYRKQRLQSKL